MKIKTTRTF